MIRTIVEDFLIACSLIKLIIYEKEEKYINDTYFSLDIGSSKIWREEVFGKLRDEKNFSLNQPSSCLGKPQARERDAP
jgi:hypothetical protein